jgi:hypothetical protein
MGETIEDFSLEVEEESGQPGGRGLKPSRAVGGSLNALVRATALYRKGVERFSVSTSDGASETQRQVAERAAKIWRRAGFAPLDIDAMKVMINGEEALRADNEHAQWVLFAFMAGVRRITPRRAMTASDVIRLVQALVALEPTVESIEQFRDWLDADGAEGFDVRVHTSFREVFEEIDLEEEREFSKAFAMARFEVPRSGDAVWIAARDLDLVAMRKEFEVPIEMYANETAAAAADGGMSDDELAAIGARCDDANAWTSAEIEAVLALHELRTAITPEQMARRVVTRLTHEADERFLMLLTKLDTKGDPFRQAVARALATSEVGEVIARQLHLENRETVEALGRFLAKATPALGGTVVHGVLERATDDEAAAEALGSLAEWYGAAQLCGFINATALRADTAAILGRALARSAPAPADVSHVALAAPMDACLSLLGEASVEVLQALGRSLRMLWGRAKPAEQEAIAELMIKGGAADNLKLLGGLMLEGKVDKWQGKTLYALCAGLITSGLGRSHVLVIVQQRNANEQLRLIAIDCLRRDPELVKEAKRFRFAGLFDSPAVRARLRALGEGA